MAKLFFCVFCCFLLACGSDTSPLDTETSNPQSSSLPSTSSQSISSELSSSQSSSSEPTSSQSASSEPTNNSAPTGEVTVTGEAQLNATLTATANLNDADGLGSLNFQWLRNNAPINGAITSIYQLTPDDIDTQISVRVSYTDGAGNPEGVDSQPLLIADNRPTESEQPNILLVIADDLGLDASRQYSLSNDLPTTPTLDALAADGLVFENAWATPACTTTRGTIMTGKHGINSGVSFVPAIMDSESDTLFRRLANDSATNNYAAAVIGKWHLAGGGNNASADHPMASGVNYFAGLLDGIVDDYANWPLTINGQTTTSNVYQTTQVVDLALDFINGNQAQRWFVWLAFVAPHSPFHLPPESLHTQNNLSGTDDDIENNTRPYYLAAIEAMDTELGRLLENLPEGQRDNTVIIYIGDNGTPNRIIDNTVFPNRHAKGSLYEGGIRIPMTVSGANISRKNERESALVNTTDLYATILNLAGADISDIYDSINFSPLFNEEDSFQRDLNYSEFESSNVTGWTVRNTQYKLIEFSDGSQELYDISTNLMETENLLTTANDYTSIVEEFTTFANSIRNQDTTPDNSDGSVQDPLDLTNVILQNRSANCEGYTNNYRSTVSDVANGTVLEGSLSVTMESDKCIFRTNMIPNHNFNDGAQAFPNTVSEQDIFYEVPIDPVAAPAPTNLTLTIDNALLLNGVKVDLLAAGCFGVGNGRVGCNDINQPWRYDPVAPNSGFNVDTHNAHSQGDGSYHYHGKPNALYDDNDSSQPSPLIGFAADGFPIYGPFIIDNGTIRKVTPSYRIKSGARPNGDGNPGGNYDGTFRDDYEYIEGLGDLDACNGTTINGIYSYFVTDAYPYILGCFTGTPDTSFSKR